MRDVNGSTTEEIEDEIAMIEVCNAVAAGRMMVLLAELDLRDEWAQRGFASLAGWLCWRTGLLLNAAREHVRVARKLVGLPEILAALSRGEIGYSKARALTRIAKPETEGELLEFARRQPTAEIERMVRRLKRPTAADAITSQVRRELRTFWGDDGMLVVRGRLTKEQGALLLKALEASGALERSAGDANISAQRRTDALAAMADRSLSVGSGRASADRNQVVVHVDAEVLANASAEGRSELEGGVTLSAETSQRLACDASIVVVKYGATSLDIDVGRKTRVIPTGLRRAIAAHQHDKCCFPGCEEPIRDGHHGTHWIQGGGTDFKNVRGLCDGHHVLMHEGRHSMKVVDGEPRFYRPDGTLVIAAPAPGWPDPDYLQRLLMEQMADSIHAWTMAA